MAAYQSLGVRRVVNASGYTSRLGGSCCSREVLCAMNEAAGWFVDMKELHRRCGEAIARITGAEAALVTSGAAGGMLLATAACVTRGDPAVMAELPRAARGARVIVQKGHRTGYDQAVATVGVDLIEVGLPYRARPEQIEHAIDERTVALLYTFGELTVRGELLSLAEMVAIGKRRGVIVIVDAAVASYPPGRMLDVVASGADLVAFSGSKHVGGPPGTGFLCGRGDLVEAARLQAGPDYGIGRTMKVSKEEMVGLVTALEQYMERDHEAERRLWESQVRFLIENLKDLSHADVSRTFPDDAGRPVPRVRVRIDERALGITAYEIEKRLGFLDPPVGVTPYNLHEGALMLNPACLLEGDAELVAAAFRKVWKELATTSPK